MALNFPNSPVDGEEHYDSGSGITYVYQSSTNSWRAKTIFPLATDAEVAAGVNNVKFISPLRLLFGFAQSDGVNGYVKLPAWLGGWVFQWGVVSSPTVNNNAITFPLPFPNSCRVVNVQFQVVAGGDTPGTPLIGDPTVTGFTTYAYFSAPQKIRWWAFGR